MWTRAELKDRAKFAFKRNYWRSVLISLLPGWRVMHLLYLGGALRGAIVSLYQNGGCNEQRCNIYHTTAGRYR